MKNANKSPEIVTHAGYIEIGEVRLYSLVTQTGKRLITANDVFKAVGRARRGQKRVEGYPSFIGANNLLPFVDDDLKHDMQPIMYKAKNGRISEAYDATIIPKVADLYISAHDEGVLNKAQETVYKRSLLIIRALAKLGITALIDEATGYQYDRESQALQRLLSEYISEDLMKWQKRFPREFYEEIYRLYGISDKFDPTNVQRPGWIGKFTNKYVYGVFPEKVMDELKRKNPVIESSRSTVYRGHRFFQDLTEDVGIKELDRQLNRVIVVMEMSKDKDDFDKNFKRIFAKELEHKAILDDLKNGLVPLMFEDID